MADEVRVTVIATGFNKAAKTAIRVPLHTVGKAPLRPSLTPKKIEEDVSNVPASVPAGVSIQPDSPQLMLEDAGGGDLPVFKKKRYDSSDLKQLVQEIGISDFQEDEYDIPTFLRKQAD
jgi:hypothetical protein